MLPFGATLVSAAVILVRGIAGACARGDVTDDTNVTTNVEDNGGGVVVKFLKYARSQGGLLVYAFKLARVFSCIALLALSLLHVEWTLPEIAIAVTFVCLLVKGLIKRLITKANSGIPLFWHRWPSSPGNGRDIWRVTSTLFCSLYSLFTRIATSGRLQHTAMGQSMRRKVPFYGQS